MIIIVAASVTVLQCLDAESALCLKFLCNFLFSPSEMFTRIHRASCLTNIISFEALSYSKMMYFVILYLQTLMQSLM